MIKRKYIRRKQKYGYPIRFVWIWENMQRRCNSKTSPDYPRWGGRGIRIEWKNCQEFGRDMFASYKEGLTLDRIDNNGNYSKENCRWVDRKLQNNNRRDNDYITYHNVTKTLKQWAQHLGINQPTLWMRLHEYKWTIERAFETPVGGTKLR